MTAFLAIQDVAGTAGDKAQDAADSAGDAAQSAADSAKDGAGDAADAAGTAGEQAGQAARGFVSGEQRECPQNGGPPERGRHPLGRSI